MRKSLVLHFLAIVIVLAWSVTARAEDTAAESSSGAAASDSASAGGLSPADDIESDAVYEMKASLGFGLEYNDNINEQAHNKLTDMITHIRPGFSFKRLGGRLEADIQYRGDYLFYLKDKDTEEYRHYINAKGSGELVENLFFLSVHESMQQVYRDVFRGEAAEDDTLNDLINRNRFTVSPFFKLRPDERTNVTFGYVFTDIRYSEGLEDSPQPISFNSDQYDFNYKKSQNHMVYFQMDHELSDRTVLFTGGDVTRWVDNNSENETDQSFYRYTLYVGGSYEFSENLMGSLKFGPTFSDPDEQDSETLPFLEANLTYSIGRSKIHAFYLTDYEDNPNTGGSTRKDEIGLRWEKEFDRSRLTASFSYAMYENVVEDSRGTNRGNIYRPALRYTYDLTDRLSCFAAYYAALYEDHTEGRNRHYGSYGVKYELSENSSITLSHQIKYTDVYRDDSFFTNRVMLDFMYTF